MPIYLRRLLDIIRGLLDVCIRLLGWLGIVNEMLQLSEDRFRLGVWFGRRRHLRVRASE